ncbi:DUF2238 domain-containing protein [bacterium]|nr:DUF2238 domain-containing protein [bacterium]NCQ55301.1 DUF2238 domain-containing protein [Candidatus Parcubacteria bacterium]NCS67186.1 DUF2238 domain-containing protein [Candidatus Peregrinibacteria bacterium]NCS96812.1 DUF2238 domain-containing protein [bacterium]
MPFKEKILIALNLIILLLGSIYFLQSLNFEFVLYVAVLVLLAAFVYRLHRKFNLSFTVLLGLSIWAWLHIAGGSLPFEGSVLYNWQVLDLIGEPYVIFKYDQFVHFFGFAVTALLFSECLKPSLSQSARLTLAVVSFFAAMGAGALNEIVEFVATVLVPETNVGGYYNTALDLVFNAAGALVAGLYIFFKKN